MSVILKYKSWEAGPCLTATVPPLDDPKCQEGVFKIVEGVKYGGEKAVLDYTHEYDSPYVTTLEVPREDIQAARARVSPKFLEAITLASRNIRTFHERQLENQKLTGWRDDKSQPGIELGQNVTPIDCVGVYAPGGTAPLPSTVLMTVIPAKVARVRELVLCSPPVWKTGEIHPATLAAAEIAGVDRVFRIGGAQAIAAMAFGTKSVPKVDKVVGPGNRYVVLAKRLLFGTVGIESLPGPSEVLVLADKTANPQYIAADMLSQAEHGPDSRAILITDSEKLAGDVEAELERQLKKLKRREFAEASLGDRPGGSAIIIVRNLHEGIDLANDFAPEHLELLVADPDSVLPKIKNAGAILIGEYSSEPIGDYIAGPSHVLPTGGTARFSSALNVQDFLKTTSIIRYDKANFERVADKVITIAEAEGLDAHANAIRVRLEGN